MTLSTFGARSLVPDEHLEGYGEHVNYTEGFLIRPGFPLSGHVYRRAGYPSPAIIEVHVGLSEFPLQHWRILIEQAAYDAVIGGIGRVSTTPLGLGILRHPNPDFIFRWRILAASDPWTEVPGDVGLSVSLSTADSVTSEGSRVVGQVIVEDRRVDPTDPLYDATAPDLPATDDIIEFFLIGSMPPDDRHPVIIEGITAGEFLVNMYSGVYSARDPITGAVVPTGISYYAPAFAQMTDLVRIRLFEPIEDARDWAEKHIYAPTGFAPALDYLGRIAPVSQIPPADLTSLVTITDAMTQPTHEWDAGQRIINIVRFTYPRDYSIGKPDNDPPTLQVVRQNLLEERPIVIEIKNDLSIARHGEQVLELDGSAFRAIGREPTSSEEEELPPASIPPSRPRDLERRKRQATYGILPVTETPIVRTGLHALPITGSIEDETGWQMAQLRGTHLLNRYAFGAPTVTLHVMRSGIPDVWCGSWVWLNLSWFPDYVTQRRGLFALAQVVAVGELDCAWRRLRLEIVAPIEES